MPRHDEEFPEFAITVLSMFGMFVLAFCLTQIGILFWAAR